MGNLHDVFNRRIVNKWCIWKETCRRFCNLLFFLDDWSDENMVVQRWLKGIEPLFRWWFWRNTASDGFHKEEYSNNNKAKDDWKLKSRRKRGILERRHRRDQRKDCSDFQNFECHVLWSAVNFVRESIIRALVLFRIENWLFLSTLVFALNETHVGAVPVLGLALLAPLAIHPFFCSKTMRRPTRRREISYSRKFSLSDWMRVWFAAVTCWAGTAALPK